MTKDFKDIDYLKHGNDRQRLAYSEILKYDVFEKLKKYNPILTGTIPIEIDLPESDLDIICECEDHKKFAEFILEQFGDEANFKTYSQEVNGVKSTIAEYKSDNFKFEIFGQSIPTDKQNAYRHMIIEDRILKEKGIEFKNEIMKLKSNGLKTEPAFAKLLKLKGDPYDALLMLD